MRHVSFLDSSELGLKLSRGRADNKGMNKLQQALALSLAIGVAIMVAKALMILMSAMREASVIL